MPRFPLLLRSSPAAGTGSYGVLAVGSLSSSPADSVDDNPDATPASRSRPTHRRSKSALRNAHIADDPLGAASSSTQSETSVDRSVSRRKGKGRRRSSSKRDLRSVLDESLEGQHESGLDPRFNGSEIASTAEGMVEYGPFDSTTSSTLYTDDEREEEDAVDDDDDEIAPASDSSETGSFIDKNATEEEPVDNSPYAAVRASVSPTDDTSLSINTPRMWTLSMLFAILGSSTNLFFSLRYPSVSITPVIALLLVHPLGLLWDQLLKCPGDPEEVFVNGALMGRRLVSDNLYSQEGDTASSKSFRKHFNRFRLWLAQGQWNEKEHCCVYISSNVSFGFAFATDVIVEQTQFYHQNMGIVYQLLLTLSTQILGYALAGMTRNYLVRPSGMIWPGTLISTSMFSTLHKEENKPANGWTVTRSSFFLYVFAGSAAFYFLPGLLMPALSYFSVITWIAPKSVVVANLFGISSGLGMFPVTFDWAQIAYIGSPLVVPFWAALNIVGGLIAVMWIIAPILYYLNVMYSSYMPILSAAVFDNTGKPYDVSKILTKDFLFDAEAYHQYSRVFLPITYVLSYALQFAALSALISHTACWHGKDIVRQWKRSWREIRATRDHDIAAREPLLRTSRAGPARRTLSGTFSEPGLDDLMTTEDVHNRLMRRYEDVPISWYILTGVLMTAIGMFVVEYYDVHLPWYGLLLALGICTLLFIPIGIVMAITNQQSSLYLICQLICGSVFPGRPVANMVFVTYGYITSTQGLKFSSDMKLGQYMKIPPRILFYVQLSATIASSLTQIGVLNWMLSNIPGICTAEAINGFTCPIARVHFNGSILWGVVGPARFFGPNALYRPLVWAFLFGAVAPIAVWLLGRRNRKSFWRKVNLPVLFGSLSWIPPATGLNFSCWAVVCWLFNDFIRKRKGDWWRKYNMTLSAALDSGVAVGVVVIFFGVLYPGWMNNFKWWGTEVFKKGCDWTACPYRNVPEGGHFGPDRWF